MVNFKIYDITDWTTNNYNIYILPNIWRSKSNQARKFGQLTKYSVGNSAYDFFQEKYFLRYTLLTDQLSLSDCLYFLRY